MDTKTEKGLISRYSLFFSGNVSRFFCFFFLFFYILFEAFFFLGAIICPG